MKPLLSMKSALLCLTMTAVSCFGPVSAVPKRWRVPFWSTSPATAAAAATERVTVSSTPPSWEDLAAAIMGSSDSAVDEPVLTMYRDTNGWCPYCERAWVAIRVKNLPYRESLVSLQDKPQWYKDLVPTTKVPAVLFHGDGENPERRIVWESLDIMKALDEAYPNTPRMIFDTPDYEAARTLADEVASTGFLFTGMGRNDTLSEEDKVSRRKLFGEALDKLDSALGASGGPFCLGTDFSGIDAILIPTLERWRYQLPITADFDIVDGRPYIQKWLNAMDSYAPFADRVAGDQYSWTATASMFLRYFGGGEDKPDVAAAIQRADNAALMLSNSFANEVGTHEESFATEAAAKLVSNHEAVIKDCTRVDPVSQKHLARASSEHIADLVLRYATSVLLSSGGSIMKMAETAPLIKVTDEAEASLVARFVASRVCAPRDMSAPAAKVLRGVLATIAERLEKTN